MKLLNFLTIFFLLIFFSVNQTFSQQVARNYVVVEIGTYVTCGYCPGAAMGADDLVENGHQVAILENHHGGADPFTNTGSESRNSYYGITGYPTAFFDGDNEVVGGSATNSLYPTYLPIYNAAIAVMSDFTMALTYTNTSLDYDVTIDITEPGNYTGTDLVVHLVLTESHIEYSWGGLDEVNFVNRAMYPNSSGTSFTGGTQTINLSFTADAGWDIENCELVAFIQDVGTKHILQSDKATLATPTGSNNVSLEKVNEIPDICEGAITPSLKIKNRGSVDITSLTIDYDINNGATTGTYNWSGDAIPFNSYREIELDEITFDLLASNTIDFEITHVNGSDDDDPVNNTGNADFYEASEGTMHIFLELHTDNWGDECTWNIKNSSGTTVESGGPYGDNQTIELDFWIAPDCNTFNLIDSYGDGGGVVTLEDSEGTQLFYTNGSYGSGVSQKFITFAIAPTVEFIPNDSETNVEVTTNVSITFDQPVRKLDDSEIINGDISNFVSLTDPSKGNITYTGTINAGKTIITLDPDENLPELTDITVTISAGAVENEYDVALDESSATFTTEDVEGISYLFADINIYPNPANNVVFISNAKNSTVTVTDIYGKSVLNHVVSFDSEEIDINNLTSGLYIVKIELNGYKSERKLIIVK